MPINSIYLTHMHSMEVYNVCERYAFFIWHTVYCWHKSINLVTLNIFLTSALIHIIQPLWSSISCLTWLSNFIKVHQTAHMLCRKSCTLALKQYGVFK